MILGLSSVQAQNVSPPHQVPQDTQSSPTSTTSSGNSTFVDPGLTTGVPNVTVETSNSRGQRTLGILGAGSGVLLALRGAPPTQAPPRTPPTQAPIPPQTPPTRAPTPPTPSPSAWPQWARSVGGWITRQSQAFWRGLLRAGQHWIAPGFKLVVENGKVVLKWIVGGVTLGKVVVATIIGGVITLLWQTPAHAPTAPPTNPDQPDPETPTPVPSPPPQPDSSQPIPPPSQPQLPAEYQLWQRQVQQFEQNVVNGLYSNSSEDYQNAVSYLVEVQKLNQQLINQGLPPVTTQEYIDQLGARLRAGRYASQISYHLGQATTGETVDIEMFRTLTNDAQLFSERIEQRWTGMRFYTKTERDAQLQWLRQNGTSSDQANDQPQIEQIPEATPLPGSPQQPSRYTRLVPYRWRRVDVITPSGETISIDVPVYENEEEQQGLQGQPLEVDIGELFENGTQTPVTASGSSNNPPSSNNNDADSNNTTPENETSNADEADPEVDPRLQTSDPIAPDNARTQQRPPNQRTIVELGAGNYWNAIAMQQANPDAEVVATNANDPYWRVGQRIVQRMPEIPPDQLESDSVQKAIGFQAAQNAGVVVDPNNTGAPIENDDLSEEYGTNFADFVYVVSPYPSRSYEFGQDAARAAKQTPGTTVSVTAGTDTAVQSFIQGYRSIYPNAQFTRTSSQLAAPYGQSPDPGFREIEQQTWIHVVPPSTP